MLQEKNHQTTNHMKGLATSNKAVFSIYLLQKKLEERERERERERESKVELPGS
jgi:hypothetical protein